MLDEKAKKEFERFYYDRWQETQWQPSGLPSEGNGGVEMDPLGYVDGENNRKKKSADEETIYWYKNSAAEPNVESYRRTKVTLRKAEEQIENSHDEIEDFFGRERTKTMTLAEKLDELMEKKQLEPADVYTRAGLDRQLMSRLRNRKTPATAKKETLLYLSIGLMLDEQETEELLGVGGYTLTHSADLDLAVCFAIKKHFYDRKYLDEIMEYCREMKNRKKVRVLS